MAQAGYTPISLYYSTTTGLAPTAGQVTSGELAVNIRDGKLYYKDAASAVQLLASTAGASGDVVGPTSATDNAIARFDTTTGKLIQNSVVTIADTTGNMTGVGTLGVGAITSSGALTYGGVTLSNSVTGTGSMVLSVSPTLTGSLTYGGVTLSNSVTGTGSMVLSASPTLTGTAGFAALTASADSAFNGTGALQLPVGTTGQQPTGAVGKLRYNSTTNEFEGYSGSSPAWKSVGGSAISNDTTTATNLYPLFATATTGTALNVYTSNAKYLYKPSTGELQAPEILANNGLIVNNMTIATSYTLPAGYSASSVGPVVISGGVVVTVPSGSRWVVL
jgi:hypothetical protein